jgi:hypothetical protein
MSRCICLVLALLAGFASIPGGARAQAADPVVPDEEECVGVPQRSLVALFATPDPATPAPDPDAAQVPQVVSPAGGQTEEQLATLTRSVIACLNAGDYWTLITFVSDDYLLRSFSGGEPPDPLAGDLAPFVNAVRGCQQCTIEPRTGDDRLAVLAIGDAWLLDDDRTGFDLTLSNPDGSWTDNLFVAVVRSGDQWLIDQIYHLDNEATPAP